jgi:hypothetical protein
LESKIWYLSNLPISYLSFENRSGQQDSIVKIALPIYLQKRTIKVLSRILLILLSFSGASFAREATLTNSLANNAIQESAQEESKDKLAHDQWLKDRFSAQHEQLIPIVAVADMFYSCNKARKTDLLAYQVKELITVMDKTTLADKLSKCLAGDSIKSEIALNFGLFGCFHEQLADLPNDEKQQKMKLVKQAIASLSRSERQKSFTQCVTDQAIGYLR